VPDIQLTENTNSVPMYY